MKEKIEAMIEEREELKSEYLEMISGITSLTDEEIIQRAREINKEINLLKQILED